MYRLLTFIELLIFWQFNAILLAAIDQWQRTGWEVNERYILISNFVEGWRYEVRVVASNGGIYETASDSVKIFPTDVSRKLLRLLVIDSVWNTAEQYYSVMMMFRSVHISELLKLFRNVNPYHRTSG